MVQRLANSLKQCTYCSMFLILEFYVDINKHSSILHPGQDDMIFYPREGKMDFVRPANYYSVLNILQFQFQDCLHLSQKWHLGQEFYGRIQIHNDDLVIHVLSHFLVTQTKVYLNLTMIQNPLQQSKSREMAIPMMHKSLWKTTNIHNSQQQNNYLVSSNWYQGKSIFHQKKQTNYYSLSFVRVLYTTITYII